MTGTPAAVSPAELKPSGTYRTPMGSTGIVCIISVGPKWIVFSEWTRPYGTGVPQWSPRRRVLRRGWEGPFFTPVESPERKP